MRISNSFITNINLSVDQSKKSQGSPKVEENGEAGKSVSKGSNQKITSPEMKGYLKQVRSEPEVRQERIQEVAKRLQEGYYNTPEAAEKTADAIFENQ